MKLSRLVVMTAIALGSAPAWAADAVVTVYSADGLHAGDHSWYQTQFDAFTRATGIKVQYVEGGSGAIVERLSKERSNPQADVLVTPPPRKNCCRISPRRMRRRSPTLSRSSCRW
ncbi:2-aminoethylphosphonate ABC transporter substrate-binding protein [Serratia marcescens]|nr:2-aminoethylphosphonate ABC transporter substrate-binding protein [Serratia marcescens]